MVPVIIMSVGCSGVADVIRQGKSDNERLMFIFNASVLPLDLRCWSLRIVELKG